MWGNIRVEQAMGRSQTTSAAFQPRSSSLPPFPSRMAPTSVASPSLCEQGRVLMSVVVDAHQQQLSR